jgi:hypothetical protein
MHVDKIELERIVYDNERMFFASRSWSFVLMLGAWGALSCGSDSKPPAQTAARCVEMGAKVGVAGAKTGITTGVEGVKAAGKTVGGFVGGGSEAAQREWKGGKAETKRTAHAGADEVRQESKECP